MNHPDRGRGKGRRGGTREQQKEGHRGWSVQEGWYGREQETTKNDGGAWA